MLFCWISTIQIAPSPVVITVTNFLGGNLNNLLRFPHWLKQYGIDHFKSNQEYTSFCKTLLLVPCWSMNKNKLFKLFHFGGMKTFSKRMFRTITTAHSICLYFKKHNSLANVSSNCPQLKEKNRCIINYKNSSNSSNNNNVVHPINVPADASDVRARQKNVTLSFRRLFGCAISFGIGKVKKKQSKV